MVCLPSFEEFDSISNSNVDQIIPNFDQVCLLFTKNSTNIFQLIGEEEIYKLNRFSNEFQVISKETYNELAREVNFNAFLSELKGQNSFVEFQLLQVEDLSLILGDYYKSIDSINKMEHERYFGDDVYVSSVSFFDDYGVFHYLRKTTSGTIVEIKGNSIFVYLPKGRAEYGRYHYDALKEICFKCSEDHCMDDESLYAQKKVIKKSRKTSLARLNRKHKQKKFSIIRENERKVKKFQNRI
jgi:hypothetical protein